MYERVVTNVRTCGELRDEFSITTRVHQELVLSPFLFIIIIDEITKGIQDKIPWCMLFVNDIVLVDVIREWINTKLKLWRQILTARVLD